MADQEVAALLRDESMRAKSEAFRGLFRSTSLPLDTYSKSEILIEADLAKVVEAALCTASRSGRKKVDLVRAMRAGVEAFERNFPDAKVDATWREDD